MNFEPWRMDSTFHELISLDLEKFVDSYASYGYASKDEMVRAALLELRHSLRVEATRHLEDSDHGQPEN